MGKEPDCVLTLLTQGIKEKQFLTESVFLNELAVAMASVGKARMATLEEAEECLQKSSGHPLIISKVSGRYLEICPSYQPYCVYRQAEKRGLHCLQRKI